MSKSVTTVDITPWPRFCTN